MLLCFIATFPLEIAGARVYRSPKRLLLALAPAFALFVAWDTVATDRNTWSFSDRYITGWHLFGLLPVEELAFFVVIPTCSLLTFETVRRLTRSA